MDQEPENGALLAPNTIRTESALSRFPVHRLSNHGVVNIEIRETGEEGELRARWKVSYNSGYGQPGALAYKLDTLIINRKFDEIGRPLPPLIKLQSLRAIASELGSNNVDVKKALRQNASAFITAKITYKRKDGAEVTREADFTRYSLIFTGETLPDGRKADGIYLLLNEIYREILNTAQTRPLDYDYLKELSPSAQRLYELLSFQIFGALAGERPRAKMLYSYFCARAPQTRYFDYEHVKKQMYKLHQPHKRSGYIAAVEFRETTDGEGRADWEMLYTPGDKARAEFENFNEPGGLAKRRKRSGRTALPTHAEKNAPKARQTPVISPDAAVPSDAAHDPLVGELIAHGVHPDTARELVRADAAEVRRQLNLLPFRSVKRNKAGLLRDAIRERWTPPDEYLEFKKKEDEERDSRERLNRKKVEDAERAARQRDDERRRAAYFDHLRVRAAHVEAERNAAYEAFLKEDAAKREAVERDPAHAGAARKIHLRVFDDEESRLERFCAHFGEPNFDEWQRANAA